MLAIAFANTLAGYGTFIAAMTTLVTSVRIYRKASETHVQVNGNLERERQRAERAEKALLDNGIRPPIQDRSNAHERKGDI